RAHGGRGDHEARRALTLARVDLGLDEEAVVQHADRQVARGRAGRARGGRGGGRRLPHSDNATGAAEPHLRSKHTLGRTEGDPCPRASPSATPLPTSPCPPPTAAP